MPRRLRILATVLLTASAVALGACGDDPVLSGEPETGAPPATDEAQLEHIHGLGVDPDDGALYVATHHGLFRAPEGQTRMRRVGDSTQDIMGFTVAGANRFLGSGHPDPTQELPPLLGLIESRDGGRTWESISLLGEADFHVLQSAGERVYGFDGSQGRLLVSSDGGRTWKQAAPPGAVFDLAVDPRAPNRIVASTEAGVFRSADAGKGWRPLADDLAGLLTWPAPDRMYLVDGEGQVHQSGDGGRRFEPTGGIGGPPVAFTSHEDELYAALGDGTVKRSTDGGASWTVRAAP